ncbi:MAG: DUF6776 family protein [Pseudomarimonas sp.]
MRISWLLTALAWLASLVLVWQLSIHYAAPKMQRLTVEQASLREERNDLRSELDRVMAELALAQRSDQVTRGASQTLQATLAERDEEIAALRADVGFYERLVSGSAQRQGLNVHSLEMSIAEAGSVRYAITLTQSLKKGALTRGEVSLAVEGTLDGRLTELDWRKLRQDADAAPQAFEFRYFQQIEGIIMLPPNFLPQRVRVTARSAGQPTERVFPWRDLQTTQKGS